MTNAQHIGLGMKQSGFNTWLGSLYCVLGQDTVVLQCLSLCPGVQMGTNWFKKLGVTFDPLGSYP